MKTVVVQTVGELVDRAMPEQPDPFSGRLRDRCVYRGLPTQSARLLTSLDRLGGLEPHAKAHLEEFLLRNFIRYGKPFLPAGRENVWELMVIAEHHGLPTRLLDWTHSPLVAAHFATLTADAGERVVWALDWQMVHRRFGLRDVAFLVSDLDEVLAQRGICSAWEFLNAELPKDKQFVALLDPPAFTDRLSVQAGVFSFCSTKGKSLDQVLAESDIAEALTRYVIPQDRVEFIRDQLDLCTIDERRLFPGTADSLQTVPCGR